MTESQRESEARLFGHIHQAVVTGIVIHQTPKQILIDSTSGEEENNIVRVRMPRGIAVNIVGCRIYLRARIYRNSLIMENFRLFEPIGGEISNLPITEINEDGEEREQEKASLDDEG